MPIGSNNFSPRCISKWHINLLSNYMCKSILVSAWLVISKVWKTPKQSDEWIKKLWYLYTIEHCTTICKVKVLLLAAKWVELNGVMLSKTSQKKKDKPMYHSFVACNKAWKQYPMTTMTRDNVQESWGYQNVELW